MIEEYDAWLASSSTNSWVSDGILDIYVRKGYHFFDGVCTYTLDVANISSIEPEYEGHGHFKRFMLHVESKGHPVFVECIHNPLLVEMLEKNGYTIMVRDHSTHAIKFPRRNSDDSKTETIDNQNVPI